MEAFGISLSLHWSALVCIGLHWSALVCLVITMQKKAVLDVLDVLNVLWGHGRISPICRRLRLPQRWKHKVPYCR